MNGPECPKCDVPTFIDYDGRSVCPECGSDYDTAFLTNFQRSQEAPSRSERRFWHSSPRRKVLQVAQP